MWWICGIRGVWGFGGFSLFVGAREGGMEGEGDGGWRWSRRGLGAGTLGLELELCKEDRLGMHRDPRRTFEVYKVVLTTRSIYLYQP